MIGLVIFVFMGFVIWSAIHGWRGTSSVADYYVAGRQAPWWMITGSLMASTISGATFFGLVSSYYRSGFGIHWIPLGVAFSWLIICFGIGPRLRRYGKFTIPEYLGERFNSPALRPTFSVVTVIWMVFLMGSVLVQGGLLLGQLWGWSYGTSIIVITAAVIAYTVLGGQKAVLWTDVVQGAAFVIAVVILVPLAISAAGGWGEITATVSEEQPGYFSPTGGVLPAISAVSLFFIWFLGYLGHSGFLTRFYAARSEREVYKTGIAISLVYLPFWLLIGMVSAAMRVLYPNAGDTEVVWIRFMFESAPPLLTGVFLAAILAAILSSSDTWLLTAGTTTVHDIYRRFSRRQLDDQSVIFITRTAVLLLGLVALPFGLWRPTYITEMMNIAYTIAGSAGGLLILFSLYWRRMTRQAAWAGLIFGVVTAIVGRVAMAAGLLPSWADPILPTLIGTALLIVVVSLRTQPDAETTEVFERLERRVEVGQDSSPASDSTKEQRIS